MSSGSSTTIYVHDKPIVTLAHIEYPDFHSLTINYGGSEVKFFIDQLEDVEALASAINARIAELKMQVAAAVIEAHEERPYHGPIQPADLAERVV
jgi:hypothetical protein